MYKLSNPNSLEQKFGNIVIAIKILRFAFLAFASYVFLSLLFFGGLESRICQLLFVRYCNSPIPSVLTWTTKIARKKTPVWIRSIPWKNEFLDAAMEATFRLNEIHSTGSVAKRRPRFPAQTPMSRATFFCHLTETCQVKWCWILHVYRFVFWCSLSAIRMSTTSCQEKGKLICRKPKFFENLFTCWSSRYFHQGRFFF